MMAESPNDIHTRVVRCLEDLGRGTPYAADADEPDPMYKGYGVRAPAMKALIREFDPMLRVLEDGPKLALAMRLIDSGYGEQKTVALHLLGQMTDYFEPARFGLVDDIVRRQRGWSKIDAYCGTFLRNLLRK